MMDVTALRARLQQLESDYTQKFAELNRGVRENVYSDLDSPEQNSEEDWLSAEVLSSLWLIKNRFLETQGLLDAGELSSAFRSSAVVREKTRAFIEEYPECLLAEDLSRKSQLLQDEIEAKFTQRWHQSLKLDDEGIRAATCAEQEDVIQHCAQLTDDLVHNWLRKHIINPLTALDVELQCEGLALKILERPVSDLPALIESINALTQFVAKLAAPLAQKISRRWGTHLITELLRTSLPNFFPDSSDPEPIKKRFPELLELQADLNRNGWISSNEVERYVDGFDSLWIKVRRERALMRLRNLYQEAGPLNEEKRLRLIADLPDAENADEAEADEWDWNDDDAENENAEGAHEGSGDSGSKGLLIDLWQSYRDELEKQVPDPFLTLYRAITPMAYGENDLWFYADTHRFISYLRASTAHDEINLLETLAETALRKYIRRYSEELDSAVLPGLLGGVVREGPAFDRLKTLMNDVAVETNQTGGPPLRQSVLSQLVEQLAAYIIQDVGQRRDIGESESQQLAVLIAKVSSLAVYFDDVNAAVPSWTKLETLRELLLSNLSGIEELHDRGRLVDFSSQELQGLVEALFVDSPKRSSLIKNLYQEVDHL